jgi:hypothetical protein
LIFMSLSWTSQEVDNPAATNPAGTGEARVSERIPVCCPARLSHADQGDPTMIRGRVLNMSGSGVLIEARKPITVGSQMRIQANELLVGTAFVRHSTRRFWRFRIGLEFATAVQNRY